jgi:hypothetical protein
VRTPTCDMQSRRRRRTHAAAAPRDLALRPACAHAACARGAGARRARATALTRASPRFHFGHVSPPLPPPAQASSRAPPWRCCSASRS